MLLIAQSAENRARLKRVQRCQQKSKDHSNWQAVKRQLEVKEVERQGERVDDGAANIVLQHLAGRAADSKAAWDCHQDMHRWLSTVQKDSQALPLDEEADEFGRSEGKGEGLWADSHRRNAQNWNT